MNRNKRVFVFIGCILCMLLFGGFYLSRLVQQDKTPCPASPRPDCILIQQLQCLKQSAPKLDGVK